MTYTINSASANEFGFTVVKIEDAVKAGHKVITVKFDGSDKEYTYIRKAGNKMVKGENKGLNRVVIKGVYVYFNNFLNAYDHMERCYEVQGKNVKSSVNMGTKAEKVQETIAEIIASAEATTKFPHVDLNSEITHEKYAEIRMCLECGIPVYLAGPAGSGKNYTVEQICNDLGWGFYFSNSVQQEYKLTGFVDAGGDFHETEFYKACTDENECVFFLDEMDASIPEVLVLLNAAIANGYFEFPTGRVDLGNVHFVAAGNTVGNGADDQYTGRMVIDQATLDRFAIIEFSYSTAVEMSLSKNNDDLVEFIHALREDAEAKGIRATFSYRCITMVTKLEAKGADLEMIIRNCVVKGLDKDTVNTLKPNCFSKYSKALREVQKAS